MNEKNTPDGISKVYEVIQRAKNIRAELVKALGVKDVVCYESTNGDHHDKIINPELAALMILGDIWQDRESWKHVVLRTKKQSEEHEAWVNECEIESLEAELKRRKALLGGK